MQSASGQALLRMCGGTLQSNESACETHCQYLPQQIMGCAQPAMNHRLIIQALLHESARVLSCFCVGGR